MSARLTPLAVAQRQLDAWRGKEYRLHQQLAEIQDNIRRWETIYAGLVEEAPEPVAVAEDPV